mgnify:FL=1
MQTERLFEIVYTLLDRGTATAQELADQLGVSKRTILRDIETLTLAKVPVYTTQGKGGGVSLLEGYVLDKAVLSDEEKEQILLGIKTLLPTGGASGKALSKLGSLFSVKNTDWIEVDFSRWSNPTHDREKFDNLKNAVMQRKALAFSYPNSVGEISERKAYPLKLVFQGQAWYVQAFCLLKKDYRTFKINRMIDLQVLPETFDAALYAPPPVVPQNIPPHVKIHIRAIFTATVAYRVYDEFNIEDITKTEDGTFIVDTTMIFDEWVYGYFLSFGNHVHILEPISFRQELRQRIGEMLKNYSE